MKRVDSSNTGGFNPSFPGMPPVPPIEDENVIDAEYREIETNTDPTFNRFKGSFLFDNEWKYEQVEINSKEQLEEWYKNNRKVTDYYVQNEFYDKYIEDHKDEIAAYEAEQLKKITIRTATPFIINTNNANGKDIATLSFLCVLNDDSLITISRNYIIDNEEDKEVVSLIDFHADSEFINNKICYNFIAKYLPSYFSSFRFKIDDLDDNLVTLECIDINDRSKTVFFRMNSEVFACMNFIDDYIFNGEIENTYDLKLATVAGSKPNSNVEFFNVDKIEKIVTMVSTAQRPNGIKEAIANLLHKEENTGIGVVFKASRPNGDSTETISVLTPFDIGIELDKSKFKGDTIESVQRDYYGDADQFVATLIIEEIHVYGIDKSYMMIRAKNKDGKTYIMMLDNERKTDLIHAIKNY